MATEDAEQSSLLATDRWSLFIRQVGPMNDSESSTPPAKDWESEDRKYHDEDDEVQIDDIASRSNRPSPAKKAKRLPPPRRRFIDD